MLFFTPQAAMRVAEHRESLRGKTTVKVSFSLCGGVIVGWYA